MLHQDAIWFGVAGIIGLWLWRRYLRYIYYYYSPVAYPGGPMKRRLARRGKWNDQESTLEPGWVFLHAEDSHKYTAAKVPEAVMSGEPAGRQMWARLGGEGTAAEVVASIAATAGPTVRAESAERPPPPARRPSLLAAAWKAASPRTAGNAEASSSSTSSSPTPPPLSFNPSRNPNSSDKLLRAQNIARWEGPHPDEAHAPATPAAAARKGVAFYQMLQCADGHWAGDYGGPMFLMPGLIVAHRVMGEDIGDNRRAAMSTYLRNHQQADGGWGTHIECASTMFGSVLCYVALRLLGAPPNDPAVNRGREFIRANGGAVYTSSWAKFWLALLGACEWEGINSVPPEMWLLPRWFPFHPGRLWCHCRMVYLPMCYLYGARFRHDGAADPVVAALRRELYVEEYDSIDWDATRHLVSPLDDYSPIHPFMRLAQNVLALYERWVVGTDGGAGLGGGGGGGGSGGGKGKGGKGKGGGEWWRTLGLGPVARRLRARGMRFASEYMAEEDEQTNYIDIGPVNKVLNWVSAWLAGGRRRDTNAYCRHLQRVDDYLWVAEDGMKMQGYNGSQCWDTSFAAQAVVESGLAAEFPGCCRAAWRYFERTQIPCDETQLKRFFRHVSKGGWPFSTAAHGWPISDCTSEGLKAVLALSGCPVVSDEIAAGRLPAVTAARLRDAVNVILSLQNHDGGWATYENNRGFGWYEALNPSEVFGDIMIDYSYVECSSASLTALRAFRARFPGATEPRAAEIDLAVRRGDRFIRSIQRADGSWYGSWAVCFTYGTWFGIKALRAGGATPTDSAVARAVRFLLVRQNANGGWGESYFACVDKAYPPPPQTASIDGPDIGTGGSGVVQTAWAMLALMASGTWDPSLPRHPSLCRPTGAAVSAVNSAAVVAAEAAAADASPAAGGESALTGLDGSSAAVQAALDRGVAFLMDKQLPTGDWAQEGITGVFNRSTGITYTAYRNVFPVWALGVYGQLFGDGAGAAAAATADGK